MKKFVLVIFCTMLLAVFVAFNYLLWERENREKDIKSLEYSNADNNSIINALGREVKNLENENVTLKDKVNQLENTTKTLWDDKNNIEMHKVKAEEELLRKNEIINILKQKADMKFLEEPIRKWIEMINSEDYQAAYSLYNKDISQTPSILSLSEYAQKFKGIIKSIKIESIKLYIEEVPEDKKGDIVFDVSLEVKNIENAPKDQGFLAEGQNEVLFTLDFNSENNNWFISSISLLN